MIINIQAEHAKAANIIAFDNVQRLKEKRVRGINLATDAEKKLGKDIVTSTAAENLFDKHVESIVGNKKVSFLDLQQAVADFSCTADYFREIGDTAKAKLASQAFSVACQVHIARFPDNEGNVLRALPKGNVLDIQLN